MRDQSWQVSGFRAQERGKRSLISAIFIIAALLGSASADSTPRRQAQALNFTRGLGGRARYLSTEQLIALKRLSSEHSILVAALALVRRVRANLTATGLLGASLNQAVSAAYAPQIATLSASSSPADQQQAQALTQAVSLSSDSTYPSSWDSRASGLVSPVRDQGQCGTCVAFATTSAMEGTIAAASPNTQAITQYSPQWLYFCAGLSPGITCNTGMDLDNTGLSIPNVGMQFDACFPYQPNSGAAACSPPQCNGPLGPGGTWQSTDFLASNTVFAPSSSTLAQAILNAKAHIRQYGSVNSMFFTDNQFQSYSGGIMQQSQPWNTNNGHAVTVIGYDDNSSPPSWLCKNSWGTGWGESGFFQMAYAGTYLMTTDAVGFVYVPPGTTPATPAPAGVASMSCVGTFYDGKTQTGSTFQIASSNAITLNTPAYNYTWADLSNTQGDQQGQDWANRIQSFNLSCVCQNTGSCVELAQGMTWAYYTGVGLTGSTQSVKFWSDNCAAGAACATVNNLPPSFNQQIQSMAIRWAPTTSGQVGITPPAPPPSPQGASQASTNMILVLLVACAVSTVLLQRGWA